MIMIISHNHQLQNQCFRPSHERSNSTTPSTHNHKQVLENIIELRRSQSSQASEGKRDGVTRSKERAQAPFNNQIANHILDVKEKFKEIFKQRTQETRKSFSTQRKYSTQAKQKGKNLSVICESGIFADKRKLIQNMLAKSFNNKKLIDLKKGRLFRGTQRDPANTKIQILENFQDEEYFMDQAIDIELSDEDMEEKYLKSQYTAMRRRKEQDERIKTEKRTIEPTTIPNLTKYQSQMLVKSMKRHSPVPKEFLVQFEPNSTFFKRSSVKQAFEPIKNMALYKRNSLGRRPAKRQQNRIFKSRVSLHLNLQN